MTMTRSPHKYTTLAIAMVVAAIMISASVLASSAFRSTVTSTSTSVSTTTNIVTDTLSQASTVSQTTTATTTVTSTVTSTTTAPPPGPPVYKADQVVQINLTGASGPNTTGSFSPSEIRLVVGVNNTVLFVNIGREPAAVDTIHWPANSSGFSTPILPSGDTYRVSLGTPGLYNYTSYISPSGTFGSILVLDIPGISASTSNNDTISIGSLSLCSSCNPGLHAAVLINGTSPLADVSLYLNGTFEGRTYVNDSVTSYTYQYIANLLDSYVPIQQGKTYFVEVVAIFADDQMAVATALTTAK